MSIVAPDDLELMAVVILTFICIYSVQFYYNGVQDEDFYFKYSDLDTDVGRSCSRGGKVLLGLELITLACLAPAMCLLTVRILGVHVSTLQPAAKFLHVEAYLTLAATIGQFLSCLAWGITCLRSSSQMDVIAEMTPTGYVWLILGAVFLVASVALYWVIRSDPECVLGSVYGGQLHGTDQNEPIARNGYIDEDVSPNNHVLPADHYGGQI
jgi:hypothetical protein